MILVLNADTAGWFVIKVLTHDSIRGETVSLRCILHPPEESRCLFAKLNESSTLITIQGNFGWCLH